MDTQTDIDKARDLERNRILLAVMQSLGKDAVAEVLEYLGEEWD